MRFVIFQINADFPNKSLTKLILYKTPETAPSFPKKNVLSIAYVSRNINVLPHAN